MNRGSPFRRVTIFDPGLGDGTGHWATFSRRLSGEFAKHGITTTACGYRTGGRNDAVLEGLQLSAVFRCSIFKEFAAEYSRHCELQREAYLEDMAGFNDRGFESDDLVLFPSLFPGVFAAAVDWARRFPVAGGPTIAFLFQFSEGTDVLERAANEGWSRIYRRALRPAERLPNERAWRYFASSDPLATRISAIIGREVTGLPMPAQFPLENAGSGARKAGGIRIGYFGHSSMEKGGNLLPEIIRHVGQRFPQVRFVLHLNSNWETEDTIKRLLASPPANCECFPGHISDEQLQALMASVDVVLLPYSNTKYAALPSLVFSDAAALGKVLVLPRSTWMSSEAACIGAGYTGFTHFTAEAICDALDEALRRFEDLRTHADQSARKWRIRHGLPNFVDRLLAGCMPVLRAHNHFGWMG